MKSRTEESGSETVLSLRRRLLSGGGWALGGQFIASLSALAVNALLARLLAPNEMGVYFITLSLVSLTAIVAQLGLNQTVVRLVAESMATGRPGRARAAVLAVLRLAGVGALLAAGILVMGTGQWLARHIFNSDLMVTVIGLAAIWVIVVAFQELLAESFRGFHDIRLATIFRGLLPSVISAVLFGLLWVIQGHSDLPQILMLSILAGATSSILAGWLLQLKLRGLGGNESLHSREILTISFPLLLANLTLFAQSHADIWVLGAFRPQADVAIYGAAARLGALVAMPLIVANAVLLPVIAEMYSQGKKKELEQVLRTTATLASIPAFTAVLVFAALGSPILGWVYGDFYRGGEIVLTLISLGQLVNVWAGSSGLTLIMTGHQNTIMSITIFSGLLTIGGSLWVVRDYGASGVASVAALTMILQNILMTLFAKSKTDIWTHARFSPAAIRQMLTR